MPLGAGLGLGLGMGPQGMWIGLIVGLTAAAVMMGWRLRRSSQRVDQGRIEPDPLTPGPTP